jgi:phosphoglycolate phosphatase-like HAD superfamily hydrolase
MTRTAAPEPISRHVDSRCWDAFDVYLFDIDGTLLCCRDAVHYFAFCETLTRIAGRPLGLEGVVAHGNTDVGIVRDALKLAGCGDEMWRPHLAEMREEMCERVRARRAELCIEVMPQVREVLEHLLARGALLGVVTGNLQGIGRIKLEAAGLLPYFSFAGWSDEFEYRQDVVRAGVAEVRKLAGMDASMCMIGDTPADIQAAHCNDLPVIAVATGIYPVAELSAAAPELCIGSLAELFVGGCTEPA